MRAAHDARHEHAVVIGASMAGLLAARVLHERYRRVTLLDRDSLPHDAIARRGVPQGRHTHALLARGRDVLEAMLPGLTAELVAAGAPTGSIYGHVRLHNEGHLAARSPGGPVLLCVSRPMLEATVRRRVAALGGVQILDRRDVTCLLTSADGHTVTGVRTRHREDDREEALDADLVVDASGRTSRVPAWLEELGYAPPREEHVRVGIAYATRLYRRARGQLDGDEVVLVGPTDGIHRIGVICANEGDRWSVSLGGYLHDHPPTDPAGFDAFAAGLARPDIARAIAGFEPISDIVPYRFQASLRRRYERLRRFPQGLLVIGDAICSFNPVFGQGMSAAALQAEALGRALGGDPRQLARSFFARAAKVIDVPWQVSVGADLRYPEVEGARSLKVRLGNAYSSRVFRAAAADLVVSQAFSRVINLYDRPEQLMRPTLAARVLRANLAARRAQPLAAAAPSVTVTDVVVQPQGLGARQ